MKYIIIFFLIGLLLSCSAQSMRETTPANVIYDHDTFSPAPGSTYGAVWLRYLYGTWFNAFEQEVDDGKKIYYAGNVSNLPRVRYRHKMVFYQDGRCESYKLVRGDGYDKITYYWRLYNNDPSLIQLYNEDGSRESKFRIETLQKKMLIISWEK